MAIPQAHEPKTRNTVTVGCKIPSGLQIRLHELGRTEDDKPIMNPVGDRILLNGANSSNVVGGFGLTEIDADYWTAWLKQNSKFPAVTAGLIFAQSHREKAADQALDHKKAKTGLEPIDPDNPGKGVQRVPDKELKAAAAMA